jgi:hypothetical protein
VITSGTTAPDTSSTNLAIIRVRETSRRLITTKRTAAKPIQPRDFFEYSLMVMALAGVSRSKDPLKFPRIFTDSGFMLVSVLLVIASALLCGSIVALAAPVLRASYEVKQRNLEERFFFIKLRLVRKYYPQLHELTYTEILEEYDVESLYNDIGKSPYSTGTPSVEFH